MKVERRVVLMLFATACVQTVEFPTNQKMLGHFISFPSRTKLTQCYAPEHYSFLEKINVFEKLEGRPLLLTTVIRLVYRACSGREPVEKEAVLRALLKPYCMTEEIEWAVVHMHKYVSQYGDDDRYTPWV